MTAQPHPNPTCPHGRPPTTVPVRLPDFLILGEMKCGTTTLWDALGRFGPVFRPSDKEMHFFASYQKFNAWGRYDADGLAPYAAAFAQAPADAVCGEATPNYLSDAGACRRIHDALPHVRLVVILRDPVQRAWSHYWHQVRRGAETLGFDAALDAEPARMASTGPAGDDERMMFSYVTRGRYAEHIRRYADTFGRDTMHVVLLDDLKANHKSTIAGVARHLGLPRSTPDADNTTPALRNRATYPRSAAMDRWTRRLKHFARVAGPWAERGAAWVADQTRPLRTYHGAPRMTHAQRDRLSAAFAESDAELARFLGRELPWRSALPASRGASS